MVVQFCTMSRLRSGRNRFLSEPMDVHHLFTLVGSMAISSSLLHVGVAFEWSGSCSRASKEKAPPVNPAVRSSTIMEIELPLCCLHTRTAKPA
jgi:hypothetical protein